MSNMTSTIKRAARLSLVAIAAASAMASSAAAADRTTPTDTRTRTSIVIAAPGEDTAGKETCVGSQLACGPGSKFHAACDALHGGYEGSNPDPATNIPQTWSCRVP